MLTFMVSADTGPIQLISIPISFVHAHRDIFIVDRIPHKISVIEGRGVLIPAGCHRPKEEEEE